MVEKRPICKHCEEVLEWEPTAGWVCVRSGDDGGTYDVCVETWIASEERHGRHAPATENRRG
jgi:hypothetical protein